MIIQIDMNGTKEENVVRLTDKLEEGEIWQKMITVESTEEHSVVQGAGPAKRQKPRG
jgi:hypothetical protein